MALIVPVAFSPYERMAVRGYGEPAREVISRTRATAEPALPSTGSTLEMSRC